MKLHLDREAFLVLMNDIHTKTGYRTDVLEKDYYVVLMLEELKKMQNEGLQAYFKGGTALYKALKTTNRFSEDIDLSVDTRECSRTQSDKRLERSTKKYTSLPRDVQSGQTNRSEIISIYHYDPLTVFDRNDALQRFGKLKVEATSFTISEPVQALEVSTMLYDLASDSQREILRNTYDVAPFSVLTMTLERIFVDKLFAAEAYVRNIEKDHRAFDAAKHIYDVTVMADHPQIQRLLCDEKQMQYLINIRMEEERSRLDGIPDVQPRDFIFFTQAKDCARLSQAYEIMQNQYVLRDCDRIPFEKAIATIGLVQTQLEKNRSWTRDYTLAAPLEKDSIEVRLQRAKAERIRREQAKKEEKSDLTTANKHKKRSPDLER